MSDLLAKLEDRLNEQQLKDVYKAYLLAAEAHDGQVRKSGEAYIFHPLAVANIVVDMNLDHQSIIAAILHDVLEDTDATREMLVEEFGEEIAHMVDGLSKLTSLEFHTPAEKQAANFQKMLLAMVRDIRIILIKLADRLHNMRTLGVMRLSKKRRIARETLDIFAPIANRLGIYVIKNELEDLGFQTLYPMRYQVLKNAVKKARGNRKELVQKVEILITAKLEEAGINGVVRGREKHLYSLYQKMRNKQLSFQEVYDVYAVRVVVDSIDDCYRSLGVIHSIYKPVPTKFKDYIAIPKANGYQSLHTVLINPAGIHVEIQIRTHDMDEYAETGVAAHWVYKDGGVVSAQGRTRQWISNLMDLQQNAVTTVDFFENVKVDLFPHEIYVFSPKGDIFQLPLNSTPVDFAYAVHSQIGNTCITAKIDRRWASLSTPLESGQTVEIITSENASPSPLWLNFVVTGKARAAIRHYLKNLDEDKAAQFGRRLIDRALGRYAKNIEDIPASKIDNLLEEFHFDTIEALFIDVGLGNHLPSLIAGRLMNRTDAEGRTEVPKPTTESGPLIVEGREGTVLTLAKCCRPIPGDNIQGFITPGQGVVVHRASCKNIKRFSRRPKEWVQVEWSPDYNGDFFAEIVVELVNKPGALASVATTLSSLGSNIENIRFENQGDKNTIIHFALVVEDRHHLARIIRRLRNLSIVQRVKRDS
ncbi:MAG: bifunctional (p)ppGpp synthetase/guanosine-3',5'-bis(diphosphate) 3'-pyrophosphohydrolase [Gammaproteobacteria bacterium]|nr:bifunctional (p)ppGpp synthetase/guanosine-3',5'-bis(diphosphate) 3'-pyrophosphohydrolase [Gammaproteobacteria bacterium]